MTADFTIQKDNGRLVLAGALDLYHAQSAGRELRRAMAEGGGIKRLDMSGLTKLDTVGAMLVNRMRKGDPSIAIEGLRPEHEALFEIVSRVELSQPPKPGRKALLPGMLEALGLWTVALYRATFEMIGFFGHTCAAFARVVTSRGRFRLADVMHHIEETGIEAMPIVALIAFLIAVVLAYQGAAQLKPLGGEQYTVNLVAISVLREMGVLLTAIMVAGRSGSAFAAEIGVMKVREEVDALQVIGIAPFEVLVLPRLIGLLITLPILTFMADLMGLFGGGVISLSLIHIPLPQYFERVRHVAQAHDFIVGMIKAPFFAFLIAMVGCMHGMKVSGSAESVGRETTAAVVKSIFLVLVADALFSIMFQKMGI